MRGIRWGWTGRTPEKFAAPTRAGRTSVSIETVSSVIRKGSILNSRLCLAETDEISPSTLCRLRWKENRLECLNALPQRSHWKGRSPVCELKWSIRICLKANERLQTKHWNGFFLRWNDFTCRCWLNFVLNVLPQPSIGQLKVFASSVIEVAIY